MLIFWSIAALLVVVTLAVLLFPLFAKGRSTTAPDADAAATAVYRDQKRALDAERSGGVINADEHEAALAELSRRLGEDIGAPAERAPAVPSRKRAWVIAVALAVLIPSSAFILYAWLGKPEAIAPSADERNAQMSEQQVLAMVDSLAQRLKARPDDADGWVLLARSYHALGRFAEAADAYARADALVPGNASLLADYADAAAMAQGRKLAGKPAALAARALAIDPNQKKALALAATAALEAGDLDGALRLWRRLARQLPQGSEDVKQVAAIVAEVEAAKSRGKATPPAAAQGEQQAAPRTTAAPVSASTITGRVDISPALASKVALTDTVFIFARAVEGPRMPLAVLRLPAKALPKEFRLDDSMGMAAGAKLSAAPAVIVEARISKTGDATPRAGDLSGKSAPVKPGASGVNITIDDVVR